jgi:hypothetical protein
MHSYAGKSYSQPTGANAWVPVGPWRYDLSIRISYEGG